MATGGGFGFIGAGTDTSALSSDLANATKLLKTSEIETTNDVIPIGIGLINWRAELAQLYLLSQNTNQQQHGSLRQALFPLYMSGPPKPGRRLRTPRSGCRLAA